MYKFTESNWQEWRKNPQGWWKSQGEWTPEQQAWWSQNWESAKNWSWDEFKSRVQKSKLFAGMWDWS